MLNVPGKLSTNGLRNLLDMSDREMYSLRTKITDQEKEIVQGKKTNEDLAYELYSCYKRIGDIHGSLDGL